MASSQRARSSRRIAVSREGWYYLFILMFIIGGAVMRQINPLFALAGLMIAPLLFNWRMSMTSIRDIAISRRLPPRISAGEVVVVDVEVANRHANVDAWSLCIEDEVRWQGRQTSRVAAVEVLVPVVPARGVRRTSYRCETFRRGEYIVGPAKISCSFPFGLLKAQQATSGHETLLVSPRLGELQRGWHNITIAQRASAQAAMNRRGDTDGDFFSLRQYRQGDSRRWIHWRSTAKQGQLMVQQFEQLTDRHLTLLIDLWQPEKVASEDLDAVELTASFAATATIDLCRGMGGQITISIAAETPFYHTGVPSKPLQNTVLDYLAAATASAHEHPLQHWLEAGARHVPGSEVLLVSSRPPELLDEALVASRPTGDEIPDWAVQIPRLSVRDETFATWFRLGPSPGRSETSNEAHAQVAMTSS